MSDVSHMSEAKRVLFFILIINSLHLSLGDEMDIQPGPSLSVEDDDLENRYDSVYIRATHTFPSQAFSTGLQLSQTHYSESFDPNLV